MQRSLVATRDGVHAFDAEGQARAVAHFVVEGEVLGLDDEAALRRVIDAYGATMQWPLEIRDGGVFGPNAPTAGAPPYAVFRLTPRTIFGLPGVAGMEQEEGPRPFSPHTLGILGRRMTAAVITAPEAARMRSQGRERPCER
jgi:hypothetical protein